MRKCKKCNKDIPYRIKTEDGKTHIIPKRSYCFVCSPFGNRIPKNIRGTPTREIKNGVQYRICSVCGASKTENSENYFTRKRGGYHSYCRLCISKRTLKMQRDLKIKAVNYKGGKCQICGYDKYYGSLDFHHMDSSKKDFGISDGRSYDFNKIKSEIDKCVLVCRNCHGEIHGGMAVLP